MISAPRARGPNGTPVANNWLVDSGAQFTILASSYASQLGINLSNPITSIEGQGVGGGTVTFDEFRLTDIALPLSNGDRLVFNNPYVFVPEGTGLPAGLTAILGENLFMQSTSMIDPTTGEPEGTFAPLFSQWYLDGPGSQLVLYDANSAYSVPEPDAIALFALGFTALAARRPRKRGLLVQFEAIWRPGPFSYPMSRARRWAW